MPESDPQPVGLLLSGGLDSAILLGLLLQQGRAVHPLYVRAGSLWEREEIAAVNALLAALAGPPLAKLVTFELGVGDLYPLDHWSLTGRATPQAGTPDEAVYLPGRNVLLLLKPALYCQQNGIEELALGSLGTNPFPDARPEFFATFAQALELATERPIRFLRPLARMTKREVMTLGRQFPLAESFSCLTPVSGLHCGRCNKCEERQHAFADADLADPTKYAASNGSPALFPSSNSEFGIRNSE